MAQVQNTAPRADEALAGRSDHAKAARDAIPRAAGADHDAQEIPCSQRAPAIVVFSLLFPHSGQPQAGLFIRERMFRAADELCVTVVSPTPWFPFQGILRRWRPHFRPPAPRYESQDGIDVFFPRYFSPPGLLKGLDGLFMAVGAWPALRRFQREGRLHLIDAHFAYPDGYAARLLSRWLGVPYVLTLRGTEFRHARQPVLRRRVRKAICSADRVVAVCDALRRMALDLGAQPDNVHVIPNGVDPARFSPLARSKARAALGLSQEAKVLISVGTLVERKGFHRVLELLPVLSQKYPELIYLIVGSSGPEGDWSEHLHRRVQTLGIADRVRFCGAVSPGELNVPLSAADVFVLPTSNEGWANVFLEAMACGLPVVTTDVGGNREVVQNPAVGLVVPFGDPKALEEAVTEALRTPWDRHRIRSYAVENSWDTRIPNLVDLLVNTAWKREHLGACDASRFKARWRRRFQDFAENDNEAAIAGWSSTGLEARVRFFQRLWAGRRISGVWLDAGCGAGTYTRLLEASGAKALGMDYSVPTLYKARSRHDGAAWFAGDVTHLPVKDGALQGVLCFGVTQALAESPTVVAELVRATEANGEVWIDGLNAWCIPHIWDQLSRRLRGRPAHLRYERPGRLVGILRAYGIRRVRRYWLPILPERLAWLQKLVEHKTLYKTMSLFPPLAALLSHSFIIIGYFNPKPVTIEKSSGSTVESVF